VFGELTKAWGMWRQAQQKLADLALTNIKFEEADAEFLARFTMFFIVCYKSNSPTLWEISS
jgi:hypothetical protein